MEKALAIAFSSTAIVKWLTAGYFLLKVISVKQLNNGVGSSSSLAEQTDKI